MLYEVTQAQGTQDLATAKCTCSVALLLQCGAPGLATNQVLLHH